MFAFPVNEKGVNLNEWNFLSTTEHVYNPIGHCGRRSIDNNGILSGPLRRRPSQNIVCALWQPHLREDCHEPRLCKWACGRIAAAEVECMYATGSELNVSTRSFRFAVFNAYVVLFCFGIGNTTKAAALVRWLEAAIRSLAPLIPARPATDHSCVLLQLPFGWVIEDWFAESWTMWGPSYERGTFTEGLEPATPD